MKEVKVGILLVEYDTAVRGLARIILAHEGWRVEEAGSIGEALGKVMVDGFLPHIALIDPSLSDAVGTELVPELRRVCPKSKVIYVTGDPGLLRQLEGGNHAVLQKPFTPAQLVMSVRAALETMRPVVVVVESGRVYRRLIGSTLEQEGWEIAAASSLDEGLKLARQREAAVLFIPEPAEAESLRRLLDFRRLMPAIGVIALETKGNGTNARWYDRKLLKPYSAQEVADAVQQVLCLGAYT